MDELNKVQTGENKNPHLGQKSRNDTRWDLTYDETKRSNRIMGDVCDTNRSFLGKGGDDRDMLSTTEKNSNKCKRPTYTNKNKQSTGSMRVRPILEETFLQD